MRRIHRADLCRAIALAKSCHAAGTTASRAKKRCFSYPGDGDSAGPLMITSRSLFALAGSLAVLLAPSLATYAEEPPPAIVAYQNKPATAFDVFMLTANQKISSQVDLLFEESCEKYKNLMLLRYVTHSVPSQVVDDWKARQLLTFHDFSYFERTHSFFADFGVDVPSHHPIYTTALGPDGEKKRAKFLEKVLMDHPLQIVQMGIMSARDGHQYLDRPVEDEKLRLQFFAEVSNRTTIVLTWLLHTEGDLITPVPPLLTQLAKQGVKIREYKAFARFRAPGSGAIQPSIETRFQDFETTDEWTKANLQYISSRFGFNP